MANAIPLIRALAMVPVVNWLAFNGVQYARRLRNAGLPPEPLAVPMQPVSLILVTKFLRDISRNYGPDLPCRIVYDASILDIALLGRVALGTRTPREALTRISAALPYFCSHEHLVMDAGTKSTVIRQFYAQRFEADTQHFIHQYVVAMIVRLLSMTGEEIPRLQYVELQPHSKYGLSHLSGRFSGVCVPNTSHSVKISVSNELLDKPFLKLGRDRIAGRRAPDMLPLRGDGSLCSSARIVLKAMLDESILPSISLLAQAAGRSVRTLQRQLEAEETTFTALLEEIRRSEAMKRLSAADSTISVVASEMGYAHQASLTRAVRRWTGNPPRQFRGT